jgi:C4-dicarboxylate transporter DctQ subunit
MIKLITKIEETILFVAVSFCLCILFINVVLRYGFNNALGWTEMLGSYLQILIVYIGCSIAAGRKSQIRVSVLIDFFPSLGKYLDLYSDVMAFGFGVCLIIFGLEFVKIQWITGQESISLRIPMYLIYSILPLGGFLMAIKYGNSIVKFITMRIRNVG